MRCRTCFEEINIDNNHSLDELGCDCPEKTLREIILEIAGIDTKNESTAEFQQLCNECTQKVKYCFEFIRRAQKINEHLVQQHCQSIESSYLEELPIDFPSLVSGIKPDIENYQLDQHDDVSGQVVNIKGSLAKCFRSLTELDMKPIETTFKVLRVYINIFIGFNSNSDSVTRRIDLFFLLLVEDFFPDPIVQLEERSADAHLTDASEQINKETVEFGSPDFEESRPLKRRRGRPRIHPNSKPAGKDNTCEVCGKSFMWHKDLIRHAKTHSMEPKLQCDHCDRLFLRRDKLNDHMKTHFKHVSGKSYGATKQTEWIFAKRLYGKPVLRLVLCKICGNEFKNISALQEHLLLHKDPSTFSLKPTNTGAKDFSALLKEQTESEIKSNICENIGKGQYSTYYSIVNEFGYELSLSDTDISDDGEKGNDKYKCILCKESFKHQFQIFSHTLDSHLNVKLPLKCNVCKVQFVSSDMLRQHERRHCKNKARKFKCSRCPGKFMWVENSESHQCLKKLDPPMDILPSTHSNSNVDASLTVLLRKKLRTTKKLQCSQCDKTFIWPKDLTRHMRIHLPDREKFQCPICQRRFNRKDNMHAHMKVHGEETTMDTKKKEGGISRHLKLQAVDKNLTIAHGCKVIECTICQSKQMRLSDLKVHLINHQFDDSYVGRWKSVEKIAEQLYPELGKSLSKEKLINRITIDLAAQQYARFYSATNEIGYEMNLSSSETDTDTDSDGEIMTANKRCKRSDIYVCEICQASFDRKFKLFKHQSQSHDWEEAQYTCIHCNTKFVSSRLLDWHYNRQCKNPLKRFQCRKCPLRFMWKQNLESHVRTAHLEKSPEKKILPHSSALRCTQCNRNFLMQKDLTRHLLMQTCRNENSEVVKCLFCPRKFYRRENLHLHMLRHGISSDSYATAECILRSTNKPNGMKQIYCRICNISYPSIAALRAHLLEEANSTPSQHYNFDSPLNYAITNNLGFEMQIDDSETGDDDEREISNSISKSPYQCGICNLFAKRKYELAQHQLSMHKYEQLPFKCDRCIFRTVSQDVLSQHMRSQCYNTDKQFQCDICQFKFMWHEILQNHMRLNHCETQLVSQKASDEGIESAQHSETSSKGEHVIFQCDKCPCKYNRKDRLSAHIKKMHNINSTTDSSIFAMSKKKTKSQYSGGDESQKATMEKKFLCAFCGRGLTSSSNLIIHMRRHTGDKPFKCDFCDMAFPRSSDLSAHRRKHTGERPHPCTICEKAFSRSYKLMLHMRTHTGERPHKCTYCEKSFTQSNDLTLHIRRHTGERPYVCGCGERFIQGTALKNHRMMRGHYETEEAALPVYSAT